LFTNLIKNAIEATEEVANPVIVVKQELANGRIKVSVTDNGKGIAQEMKQKIFTPNFTTKSSGTGLGLAICKGIVEKANGHIGFETEEHIGTTFLVELPSA
jgi:signal transduction histidine kinase